MMRTWALSDSALAISTIWHCAHRQFADECGLCAMDVLAVDGEIDHRDVFLSAHAEAATTASVPASHARWVRSRSIPRTARTPDRHRSTRCAIIAQFIVYRATKRRAGPRLGEGPRQGMLQSVEK